MEVRERPDGQLINSAVLIVALAAIVGGVTYLMLSSLQAAAHVADPLTKRILVRLAWVALLLLALAVILLVWAIMRLIRSRISFRRSHSRAPYVDAWALAGQRVQLDEEDMPEQEDDGDVQEGDAG